jgi:hypothetical protein
MSGRVPTVPGTARAGHDADVSEITRDPRRVVEKAVWQYGVQGDSCAVLAAMILDALDAAGWAIVPSPNSED